MSEVRDWAALFVAAVWVGLGLFAAHSFSERALSSVATAAWLIVAESWNRE